MNHSYSIGRIFGIPVRVHITLLIFLPLFALSFAPVAGLAGLFYGILGAVGLFGSVVLHEVGHSLVARTKGSHILEILLLPIGGMARLSQMPRRPVDEIQTALAGPAVSFILGLAGLWAAPLLLPLTPPLAFMIHQLGRINIILAIFNLIPSFPMDGGRVFRAALVPRLGRLAATQLAAKVGRGIAWVFGALALWPLLHGGGIHFSLLLIAFFVHQAAGAEARMATREATQARRRAQAGGEWHIPDSDVRVSPPPYGAASADARPAARGVFDDLLRKWR
ncbi:MAG: site-2 protease family protein [Kiritimatiellae bacterium]|nr:site-2 protease family protein [Kiritimatiellia bacterium]MDD4340668.1 site-2 protease family protein [Kiritimatiellia bacterium]